MQDRFPKEAAVLSFRSCPSWSALLRVPRDKHKTNCGFTIDIPGVLESKLILSYLGRNELIGSQLSYGICRAPDSMTGHILDWDRATGGPADILSLVSSTRILRVGVLTQEGL